MSKAEIGLRLRDARLADAPRIAELSDQLGYAVGEDKMRQRLERLLESASDRVIVAESTEPVADSAPKEGVIGWIHVLMTRRLESGEFAEISGLVIDHRYRGKGVGERLLRRAEAWARECGVDRVRVRTNVLREDAHRFYERLGYAREKSQHVFERTLWRI